MILKLLYPYTLYLVLKSKNIIIWSILYDVLMCHVFMCLLVIPIKCKFVHFYYYQSNYNNIPIMDV